MVDEHAQPDAPMAAPAPPTRFRHFTTVSQGEFGTDCVDFDCPAGPASMTMRVWAADHEEAVLMGSIFASQVGFRVTGPVRIEVSTPDEPALGTAHAYGIVFRPKPTVG